MYKRSNLDKEIPGHEGDVDPFYKNTLNKSIVESWWTKLFPDAFQDDLINVVDRIIKADFPNLFEESAVYVGPERKANTYTTTCLSLRSSAIRGGHHHRLEKAANSPLSVYTVDRGLYRISQSMVEVLERYFDDICDLHCYGDDTFQLV